jgi:hypothetical protein
MTPDTSPAEPAGSIVCPITFWYYRRMGLIALMCAVFAGLFFKDGAISWPAEAAAAERWEDYKTLAQNGYDEAKAKGTIDAWRAVMEAKGYPIDASGEPMKWVNYAAAQGWPEKPKKRTAAEIREQFYWGYGMVAAVVFCLGHILLNFRKTLRAEHDHWITPEKQVVHYADAHRIDMRKWNDKALAYVFYRTQPDEAGKKAIVDDLKYEGAGRVMDRILQHFKGELIEKVEEPLEEEEEEPSATPEKSGSSEA